MTAAPREQSRACPVICLLSEASADDLADIERESNRPPWTAKLFASEFNNTCSAVFGARLEGQLVGFLVCHTVLDETHIVNFGVRASFRGRGIGRALIEGVLIDLHERGVRWVTLEVRVSNAAARALYDSLGFIEQGVRVGYYRDNAEDGLIMRLNTADFLSRQRHARNAH